MLKVSRYAVPAEIGNSPVSIPNVVVLPAPKTKRQEFREHLVIVCISIDALQKL